jgi:hypothetical protein
MVSPVTLKASSTRGGEMVAMESMTAAGGEASGAATALATSTGFDFPEHLWTAR